MISRSWIAQLEKEAKTEVKLDEQSSRSSIIGKYSVSSILNCLAPGVTMSSEYIIGVFVSVYAMNIVQIYDIGLAQGWTEQIR